MALASELLRFRAPGVKLLTEVVETTPQATPPSGARILVVNSRKGPVNSMVLVSNFNEYRSYFDDINDADERRGNWSARSAQYMLDVSPIYVLNLRQFSDTLDLAGLQEISAASAVDNPVGKTVPYTSLFNRQQFWKIDPNQLLADDNTNKLLVFGNVGASNLSVFVRKTRTNQSSLTFDQWYRNLSRRMPSYVNPSDKVSDWMIDVVIFDNKFNSASSSNISYGYVFNNDGSVKSSVVNASNQTIDGLEQLTRIPESGYLATITGSLVQGFADEYNNNLDVVSLVNNNIQRLGLVAKRNEQIFDNAAIWNPGTSAASNGLKKPVPVDMKGHSLCSITTVGTFDLTAYLANTSVSSMSYGFDLSADAYVMVPQTFVKEPLSLPDTASIYKMSAFIPGLVTGSNISTDKLNQLIVFEQAKPSVGDSFVGYDGNLATVTKITLLGQTDKVYSYGTELAPIQPYGVDVDFPSSHDWENAAGTDNDFTYAEAGTAFPKDITNTFYVYPVGHILAGIPLIYQISSGLIVHNPPEATLVSSGLYRVATNSTITLANAQTAIQAVSGYTPTATIQVIELADIEKARIVADDEAHTRTKYQDILETFGVKENVYNVEFDKNLVHNNVSNQSLAVTYGPETFVSATNTIELDNSTIINIFNDSLVAFKVVSNEAMSDKFVPLNLASYVPRTAQFIDGTATRQSEILDTLLNTSLRVALQNLDLTSWNYIVDGFKSYIEPSCKYQLKTIAEERILGRAIYNMPSIYDFSKSTNPYFRQTQTSQFETRYIPVGGNTELPYSNSFSLASDKGFYAYGFGPNLLLSDGSSMPPAAVVSNNFARKYLNNKPYAILAGPVDGLVGGRGVVDVEYVFNEKNDGTGDRDVLDPFGYNVILKKQASGLQIYGNRTSQNTVTTPMSSIHTSEIVMYLQSRIRQLLERFVFKYNTAQNRLVIKTEADQICNEPFSDGAISGFVNQMDEQNNTSEVINNRIGILDTTIYANNGMEILVHRTRIDAASNTATFEVLNQ